MSDFEQDGYQIIPNFLASELVEGLKKAIVEYRKIESTYGIKDIDRKVKAVSLLTSSPLIINTLKNYTDFTQFYLIKAIFFNKNLQQNWAVGWHQDKTIAVRQKVKLVGYSNWTVKQNVPHVQPPLEILTKITTIRIALEDTNAKNGALRVIPGSHRLGILDRERINILVTEKPATICSLQAGDALIMSPLLLHSSLKATSSPNRSILHLEYCSDNLPSDLVRI